MRDNILLRATLKDMKLTYSSPSGSLFDKTWIISMAVMRPSKGSCPQVTLLKHRHAMHARVIFMGWVDYLNHCK